MLGLYLTCALLWELLAFWRRELEGARPLDLMTDRPRPVIPSFQGGSVPVELAPTATRALQAVAHEDGATLFMALLAVFSVLLNRYEWRSTSRCFSRDWLPILTP
jgi:hypothetical protein